MNQRVRYLILATLYGGIYSGSVSALLRKPAHRARTSQTASSRSSLGAGTPLPTSANCTWVSFEQTLDHFARGATSGGGDTFSQRLCIYDGFLSNKNLPSVVLFYTGNESPVEEYVNNTGLMWELGAQLDALLVFAEHRYEGESVPDMIGMENCAAYATIEQALADYSVLIHWLRSTFETSDGSVPHVPFIALGGSYGGMLSAWMRMKYPNAVAGSIAASAPVWGLPKTSPPLDGSSVAISRALSSAGGATDMCSHNLLASWPLITQLGETADGRSFIAQGLGLCDTPTTSESVQVLIENIQSVFFDMAEGDYPFPSTYITSAVGPGQYPLPAWPMQVACDSLNSDLGMSITGNISTVEFTVTAAASSSTTSDVSVSVNWDSLSSQNFEMEDVKGTNILGLLNGVAAAWAVWCNVTGELTCLSQSGCAGTGASKPNAPRPSEQDSEVPSFKQDSGNTCTNSFSGTWNSVYCNDELNLVNYLVQGAGNDMFWPPNVAAGWQLLSYADSLSSLIGTDGEVDGGCYSPPGVYGYPSTFDPYANWLDAYLGGTDLNAYTNIVFSNGLLDPWSAAGVFKGGIVPAPGVYDGPAIVNLTDSGGLKQIILDMGGHHLDLMFSDDNDPECAEVARQAELDSILAWIDEFNEQIVVREL